MQHLWRRRLLRKYLVYVLYKCAVPLIIGMEFLERIKLYTEHKYPLIDDLLALEAYLL